MSANQEVVQQPQTRSLVVEFANQYGLEPNKMLATLRDTAFKQKDGQVTNEQLAALMIVAREHNLNPFLKQIYAFPSRQGIVPVVGVDGWAKIINGHPQFDGMDFEQDDEKCTCKIYRKDRNHPTVVTEYMVECKRPTDPWNSHPKRMLRHKAMIQCARIAFSFAGIYDPDEAERVVAAHDADDEGAVLDVRAETVKKISPKKMRELVEGMLAAVSAKDGPALLNLWNSIQNDEQLYLWGELRSYERSAIKKLLDEAKKADQGIGLDKWSVELLSAAAAPEALQAAWTAVQDAYAENDASPPTDVETVYIDRKREFGIEAQP